MGSRRYLLCHKRERIIYKTCKVQITPTSKIPPDCQLIASWLWMTWQALSEKLSFLTDQFDQLEDTREIEEKKDVLLPLPV